MCNKHFSTFLSCCVVNVKCMFKCLHVSKMFLCEATDRSTAAYFPSGTVTFILLYKADRSSLLKVIILNFRFLKLPPNKCILAHGLTYNKRFFFRVTPAWEDFTELQKFGKLPLQGIERVGLISFLFKLRNSKLLWQAYIHLCPPLVQFHLWDTFTWWKSAGMTGSYWSKWNRLRHC